MCEICKPCCSFQSRYGEQIIWNYIGHVCDMLISLYVGWSELIWVDLCWSWLIWADLACSEVTTVFSVTLWRGGQGICHLLACSLGEKHNGKYCFVWHCDQKDMKFATLWFMAAGKNEKMPYESGLIWADLCWSKLIWLDLRWFGVQFCEVAKSLKFLHGRSWWPEGQEFDTLCFEAMGKNNKNNCFFCDIVTRRTRNLPPAGLQPGGKTQREMLFCVTLRPEGHEICYLVVHGCWEKQKDALRIWADLGWSVLI